MKLIVLHSDYGKDRYFQFYLKDGNSYHCKWSKKFNTSNDIDDYVIQGAET